MMKKLSPAAKSAVIAGSGLTALLLGYLLITKKDSAASPSTSPPAPSPMPGPSPSGDLVGPVTIEHKGFTGTIFQDSSSGASRGLWNALYSLNGKPEALHDVRTNQSGIVDMFNARIDQYLNSIEWLPLGSPVILRAENSYRLSIPADSANSVALPILSAGGVTIPFDKLPVDWPAGDRNDPSRVRYQFNVPSGVPDVPLPGFGGFLSSLNAWILHNKAIA